MSTEVNISTDVKSETTPSADIAAMRKLKERFAIEVIAETRIRYMRPDLGPYPEPAV